MTFPEAYAISQQTNLHIRRAAWAASKWIIAWGTGECWDSGARRVILATDLGKADMLADDWTTVPAPLAACPVTPTEPIGGGPPSPGTPGFPGGGGTPPTGFPPPPGSPPPVGGGDGPPLPAPDAGTSLSVTFAGIAHEPLGSNEFDLDLTNFNKKFTLEHSGEGAWTLKFQQGFYSSDGGTTPDYFFVWEITATLFTDLTWHVSMICVDTSPAGSVPISGGFNESVPKVRHVAMTNAYLDAGFGTFHSGTATVN